MRNQEYFATMQIGGVAFSTHIAQSKDADELGETAKRLAKERLADPKINPASIGCAHIVIMRSRKETAFDNRIVRSFVVLK